MSPDIPAWQSIDPTGGDLPEPIAGALDSADSTPACVVVWVTPEIERHWGASASLLLARGWAARGRSVLLADASFEDPVLHELVDGAGDEGLSDVMLYGASVKRVARPVDGGFLLAPAGTPVADAEEVLAHPKWDTVIGGFQEAGAVLVLHLSASTTGAGALLDKAAGIILVSEAGGDAGGAILGAASERVLAVIGPEAVMDVEVDRTSEPESELASTTELDPESEHGFDAELEVAEVLQEEPEPEVEMVSDLDDDQEAEFEADSTPEPELDPTSESESEPELESGPELGSEPELELEPPVSVDETPAGVTQEVAGDGELFSMEELPESTGNAADQTDDSGAFNFDGMAGSQYDASSAAETEDPTPPPEVPDEVEPVVTQPDESAASLEEDAPSEEESEEEAGLDLDVAALEMEPSEVESLEVSPPEPDEPAAAGPEAPVSADEAADKEADMMDGVTRSNVEMDEEAVAAAAEAARLDMAGFETGSGFDLEDAPDDQGMDLAADAVALGGESEEEMEGADDFGFGDEGLEVEASAVAEEEEQAAEEDLAGAAGDVPLGGDDAADLEAGPPELSDDVPIVDAADGSIAVDAAAEVMEVAADTPPAEDTVPDIEVVADEGPPARMSGLEELERRRKRGARLRQLMVAGTTALIVGGGGLGVAYFGLVNIPGITPPDRVRSAVPAPVELPGPTPVTPVITHVLAVEAWRNMETALSTVEALRARLPEFLFFVTVTEVDGGVQYALLAGPAFSAVEADDLKEPLAEVLDRLDPTTWTVQEARYSFFFGEYAEDADAAGRVESLAALSIPTHILEVSYPDETTAMRVYGGAFVDEFQAAAMGRLLRSNDLGGVRLTERRGRLPQ